MTTKTHKMTTKRYKKKQRDTKWPQRYSEDVSSILYLNKRQMMSVIVVGVSAVCWRGCWCVYGTDRSPDLENYWEDDDDSFSSEQEGSDDAIPPQVTDSSAYLFSWHNTPVSQHRCVMSPTGVMNISDEAVLEVFIQELKGWISVAFDHLVALDEKSDDR